MIKNYFKIKSIFTCLGIVAFLGIPFGKVEGYFESRFFCSVSEDNISVALNKNDSSYKSCIKYLSGINKNLDKIDKNIDSAGEYIEKGISLNYRRGVKEELISKREILEDLKERIIRSMNSFEESLFEDIHKVISYRFEKKIRQMEIKKENIDNLIEKSIKQGDKEQLQYYIDKRDSLIKELTLIEKIVKSQDFQELMPLLKIYFEIY